MAEPLDHAYVFNFDQFYLAEDPDEHLVDGGVLLLAELNCTACHAAPAAWQERLTPKPGPNLAGVGSRLSADALWLLIRSPQHRKKGTQMPGLFANEEGDAEKVEALVEYLSSLKEPASKTKVPKGDAESGKKLYHEVGCVACHEPATDYRPPGVPADETVEKPGNASVPIALADDYDEAALAHFLSDPLRYRPAGRMPSMHLSAQEAADVAAYLHTGRVPEKQKEREALGIPKQTVARGGELFSGMRCVVCHAAGPTGQTSQTGLTDLIKVNPNKGCMAVAQPTGTPRFDLNELEKRALKLALAAVKKGPPLKVSAAQAVDWQMSRLNCYACHDRNGKGGPEDPRAAYFGANDAGAESLGQLAHLPPMLDGVGHKLTPQWLAKILWGEGGAVRSCLNVRMPNFGEAQTKMLVPLLAEADVREKPVSIDVSGLQKHHRAELGRALMGTKGLACVACHGLKDKKSLGPPVIRLTHTVERLQPEYFKELLLNPQATQQGTVMPPLFVGRKKAGQEIESIWTYLRELDGQPLPEGLLSTEDLELKPAKAGRPIVFRSFIEGAGTHAIGVGFPEGVNAAFDAVKCEWRVVWRGRFLDAMSNWQTREMPPVKPLGTDVKSLTEERSGEAEFKGYRIDKAGVPTMLYTLGGQDVEDTLRAVRDGRSFQRIVKQGATTKTEVVSW
ncbi:MAG: c-type cytochrome [Verrucomicrobiaceae bacterium]|nr:c-type cytochrome [Verrucomicrobiaceae bacterium]